MKEAHMSIEAMAVALSHSQARGTTRLILIGIASHDGDGGSWPSIATLRKYAGGVDVRTVQRSIRELVELGEIAVDVNGGGTNRTPDHERPNLYHVLLRCPEWCDGSKQHRDVREADEAPASVSPPGTSAGTPPGVDVTTPPAPAPGPPPASTPPEPSLELPTEPSIFVSPASGGDDPHDVPPRPPAAGASAVAVREPDQRDIARKACEQLADLIRDNDPHRKRPTVTDTWVTDMERLHRIDERPWQDIKALIEWSQRDPFWLANVKSPAKLRKHFATLAQQRDRKPRSVVDAGRDVDAELAQREGQIDIAFLQPMRPPGEVTMGEVHQARLMRAHG